MIEVMRGLSSQVPGRRMVNCAGMAMAVVDMKSGAFLCDKFIVPDDV